jgi:hypothetical protein
MVKAFRRWRLLAPLLAVTILARPGVARAEGADIVGAALPIVAGAVGMAVIAGTDGIAAVGDCACQAASMGMGKCNPVPWQTCATAALSIGSMALGIAQAMSAQKTANAAQGQKDEGDDEDADSSTSATSPSVASTFASACSQPNPPEYICKPDGLNRAASDLKNLRGLNDTRKINLTPEQLKELDDAEASIDRLQAGDYEGVIAANGGNYSDYAGNLTGSASLTAPNALHSGGDDNGGTNGSANWAGINSRGAFAGQNGLQVGPTGAYLDKTEWNGALDQIDPRTGKSLTLWQRATRRYMGTPDGQRGYTLARIEGLRQQSIRKLAEASAPKPAKVAKKEPEEAPYVPVVLSPKEFRKH